MKNKQQAFNFDNIEESDFLNQFDESNFEEDTETEHTDYEFQIRNLLALQPIFKLFIYQSNIDKETVSNDKIDAKIDWIYLSLVGLEYIAQVSLFQKGVLFEEFCSYLAKFAKHICPELDDESAYEKANRVFDAFINQKENGRAFEFYYYSPQQQKRISYQFRLLEVNKNSDFPYYRLTKIGTEAYLLMRSIKPELYYNAEEIIVEDLITSGQYKEAVFLAKRTQVRSNQYYKEIMQQLVEAQRDIHDFNYVRDLKDSLDSSMKHVEAEIGKTSTRLASLEKAKRKSKIESKSVSDINRLQKIFEILSESHDRLFRKLLGADDDYLNIQINKFKKPLRTTLPSLEKEIFPIIAELNLENLSKECDTVLLPFFSCNRKRRVFDLDLAVILVNDGLEKEAELEIVELKEQEVEDINPSYPECFDKEIEEEALRILLAILQEKKEIKIYELMQNVQSETENAKVLDYLAYLIYAKYSKGEFEKIPISIEKDDNKFHYLHMRGDSLLLKHTKD
ncbi:MAG: Unknown protein [uncultured Sulfurovum sp.]|uniref:Uncharacterized protein n=1 Tax=uncultured Sulfurovum sp. TaxID=269237 RepID=A0A6S6UI37_9BACT|nr:MAG: Unknown protein [uncultured Sulfurovum sp.]